MSEGVYTKSVKTNTSRGLRPNSGQRETAMFRRQRERNAAQRLAQKSDVNGGLTRAQASTLQAEERNIRNRRVENARIVNSEGKVIFTNTGTSHSVSMPIYLRNNNITTHNHPSSGYRNPNSIAGRIGQSFSHADIANAMASNAARTRAVTGGYTFNISRPKQGWPSVSSQTVKANWTREHNKYIRENSSYLYKAKNDADFQRRSDRMYTMASHKATQAIAKRYGLTYTRKKNS